MNTPTHIDLERLLWSDPASEAFEGDARHVLESAAKGRPAELDEGEALKERVRELIELVGCEAGSVELNYEDDEEDLGDLACTAKRGAILLLHAAWAAEQALAALKAGS